MKTHIINMEGKEVKEILLPKCFNATIREDLIRKVFLAVQKRQQQLYGAYILAGKTVSASGKQSHARRKWKTLYGKGMSRVPRKTLSRRGEQFYWVGAFVPGTVGGREAHPPKPFRATIKINKKENRKAIESAIAASASMEVLKKKYPKFKIEKVPIVIDSQVLKSPPKEIASLIEKLTKTNLKKKLKIRAGKGKRRDRKYKNVSRTLLVIGRDENARKIENYNVEISKINTLNILQLAPGGTPGRVIVWTDKAIEELGRKIETETKVGGK
ncbi:MAG: 50S ribosomal protein L4 [Candidatus Pacearchaeota archaeon]